MSLKARVLFLGPPESPTLALLRSAGEDVVATEDPIAADVADSREFIVSHGYRHILGADVLERFPGRAINLHISYLPWNRGAHPNVWSVVEGTPSGVTVHHMDPGVDTGDIIGQRLIDLAPDDTLATSYDRLQSAVTELFGELWPAIKDGTAPREPQREGGSEHRVADFEMVEPLLDNGWDTPVASLRARARERGLSRD